MLSERVGACSGIRKRIEDCLRETTTTAITRLGNDIADNLITPRMRDRFQQEIVKLAGSRVRVEVVRSGGKFGSPQYEVKLYANPKAKVHYVLSEGEQTCVALASYLTELANASHHSALVFDDPVSSLDHRWRTKVAKRLAMEAGVRQVIVFTHDMIFVNDLAQLAAERKTPVALAHLTRGQDVVGIVNKDLPWTASSIRDRIDKLEKSARDAKHHSPGGGNHRGAQKVILRLLQGQFGAADLGIAGIRGAKLLARALGIGFCGGQSSLCRVEGCLRLIPRCSSGDATLKKRRSACSCGARVFGGHPRLRDLCLDCFKLRGGGSDALNSLRETGACRLHCNLERSGINPKEHRSGLKDCIVLRFDSDDAARHTRRDLRHVGRYNAA